MLTLLDRGGSISSLRCRAGAGRRLDSSSLRSWPSHPRLPPPSKKKKRLPPPACVVQGRPLPLPSRMLIPAPRLPGMLGPRLIPAPRLPARGRAGAGSHPIPPPASPKADARQPARMREVPPRPPATARSPAPHRIHWEFLALRVGVWRCKLLFLLAGTALCPSSSPQTEPPLFLAPRLGFVFLLQVDVILPSVSYGDARFVSCAAQTRNQLIWL